VRVRSHPRAAQRKADVPTSSPVSPTGLAPLARTVVVTACAVSAGVHAGLVPSHLAESRALGIAFAISTVALLWAAASVAGADEPRVPCALAAALLAGFIAAYAASRTIGLPLLEPHAEPLDAVGLVTQVVQGAGLLTALRLCQPADDALSLAPRRELP
jgi:hypothetical protein